MYLVMTGSENGRPAVCDRSSSEGYWWLCTMMIVDRPREIGGDGRGLGVGQFETGWHGDVRSGPLEMRVCGGGEE